MKIRCLLWDFGDTLCDERFIWDSGPKWQAAYRELDRGPGLAWNLGQIDTSELAAVLAPRLGLNPADVQAHMIACCARVQFFRRPTHTFGRARFRRRSFTVNPDLFSQEIVRQYALDRDCDAIVTSWEEATINKGDLCQVALARLSLGCEPGEALLIDNRLENIEAWIARGGKRLSLL